MASIELRVPNIGDFADVEVIELLVKPGDVVAVDQSLMTVESDKASMEIPSAAAGRIAELRVAIGDKVSEGSVIAMLEAQADSPAPAPAAPAGAPAATAAGAPTTPSAPAAPAPSAPASSAPSAPSA
ncbi:MAG TPA: biotin/lipoyl-containing protein, partial [Burkholderiaceae bacterium]|nr:biotin/lipoyl-containing protein [Burkholderiaceae bacterium]